MRPESKIYTLLAL